MPKYNVHLSTVVSATVTVEAEDAEQAIEAAYEEVPSEFCFQCSGHGQPWDLDMGGEWEIATDGAGKEIPPEPVE